MGKKRALVHSVPIRRPEKTKAQNLLIISVLLHFHVVEAPGTRIRGRIARIFKPDIPFTVEDRQSNIAGRNFANFIHILLG